MDINDFAPRSGRMLREDGTIVNIGDILDGQPTGQTADISQYAPMSGRVIKEDGTVVNIADCLTPIVKLTRAEYEALDAPDPATVYIIIEEE